MQIVVRQLYGLGNQLFQYAVGRYVAKKYRAKLRIAVERPEKLFSHGNPRPFLLSKFAITAPFARITASERLCLSISPKLELATRPYRTIRGIQIIREGHPQKFTFDLNLSLSEKTRLAYLVGLWQCYPPVQMVEAELRTELTFREPPQGKNLELARRIQAAPNAISVHLRRGDFVLEAPDIVLPIDYYRGALNYMRDRFNKPNFFVFSDEIEFARELARNNPDCVVVDHNDAAAGHEDMRLMSLCRHHVIANSTFSWWSAWLNPRADKTVVAPRIWSRVETNSIPIAFPGWTVL